MWRLVGTIMIPRFQVKERKLKMPHLFLKYYKHMFELLFLHSNDMSQLGRFMGCENYAVASIIDPIILKTSMPSNDQLSCINSVLMSRGQACFYQWQKLC